MKTYVNFGGFYNTIHDGTIEEQVANLEGIEDEYGERCLTEEQYDKS